MSRALTLLFSLLAASLPLFSAEIRISLLDDENVLNETATLLRENGCSDASVEGFKKAVHYHKTDAFDSSKLPRPVAGFYTFKNVTELNHAIPDPFLKEQSQKIKDGRSVTDLNHNSLVCLDLVILLLKDTGAKAPRLKEDFASKHFAQERTIENSDPIAFHIEPITNADFYKDGSNLLYPVSVYTFITGLNRTTNEVDLAISLKGERQLPGKFEDTDAAIQKLFTDWTQLQARDGLQFPEKLKVVFCGYIPMKYRCWAVDHIAVCFEHGGKLIYLEKNGSRGPFLRADFNNEDELSAFVAEKLLPYPRRLKEQFTTLCVIAWQDLLSRRLKNQ